jgi:hypothetical protein
VSIKVEETQVIIHDHVITDVNVVAEFKALIESGKTTPETLNQLLALGAQVVALGTSAASADKIEASVGQARTAIHDAAKGLEDSIAKQVTSFVADDGKLIIGISSIMDDFREQLESLTSDEDSPIRLAVIKSLTETRERIESDIAKQTERQRKDLATLLDPKDPTSPLRSISDRIDQLAIAVGKVREAQTQEIAVATALETGVFGGLAYEDAAFQMIQRIAAAAGDECEQTGALPGRIPRNKKGDATIDVKVGPSVHARMVMEAKNKKLTRANWEEERDGSKENRAATGFVGLCKHFEDMPTGSRIVILDPTSIVLAFDPEVDDLQQLFLVYHIVRLNCLSGTGQVDDLNIAEVNQNLEEAVRTLSGFDSIKKHATSIRNAANKITSEADDMTESIRQNLDAARKAILRGLEKDSLEAVLVAELESGELTL